MKNTKKLYEVWEEVLITNEAAKKKLTDAKLIEKMEKMFPEKAGKSTIVRVSMVRSNYNTGTGMFSMRSKAGTKKRPTSFGYAANGDVVKPGRKPNSKPVMSKSKPVAKSATKSATKKATGKKVAKKVAKKLVKKLVKKAAKTKPVDSKVSKKKLVRSKK